MNIRINAFIGCAAFTLSLLNACNKEGYREYSFKYWNESVNLNVLKEYVKDITLPNSSNFIPKERRIVTFDLDGTLYGERGPIYIEWMFFNEYYDYIRSIDPNDERISTPLLIENEYQGVDKDKENFFIQPIQVYNAIEEFKKTRNAPTIYEDDVLDEKCFVSLETAEAYTGAQLFSEISIEQYKDYVNSYLNKDSTCFNNVKYKDMLFLPMIEVVNFLQLNDFDVYIISGTDRLMVRELVNNHLSIKPSNVIGTDVKVLINWQTGEVMRTPTLIHKCIKKEKVSMIIQEIGYRPVLSFGNSYGDVDMHDYAISEKNEYRSMAFMVLADDREREYGYSDEEIETRKQDWETMSYHTFSMKNDWKTIYGENVTIKTTF